MCFAYFRIRNHALSALIFLIWKKKFRRWDQFQYRLKLNLSERHVNTCGNKYYYELLFGIFWTYWITVTNSNFNLQSIIRVQSIKFIAWNLMFGAFYIFVNLVQLFKPKIMKQKMFKILKKLFLRLCAWQVKLYFGFVIKSSN